MNSKGSKENNARLAALDKHFGGYERGTTIPWRDIELVIGMVRTERGGWSLIKRFRKRLFREREIVTLAADNVGLRLLTEKETVAEIPALRQRKAYRQVNRALREISTVGGTGLSDHERIVLTQQRYNLQQQRLQIGRSRRDLGETNRKTEVNPIRKPRETVMV